MEIIVRNLHDEATEREIDRYFGGILGKLGIKTYHCQKLKSRGYATITLHDAVKGQLFLSLHGQSAPGTLGLASVRQRLQFRGRPVNCSQSNKAPDQYALAALRKEESDRYLASQKKPKIVPARIEDSQGSLTKKQRAWDISSFQCGRWTYRGNDLAFARYFHTKTKGRVVFGQRFLRINLWLKPADVHSHQAEIPYSSIQSFTVGSKGNPSVTLSLSEAPKFFEMLDHCEDTANAQSCHGSASSTDSGTIQNLMRKMTIGPQVQQIKRKRISAISTSHREVAGSCLCYRFLLASSNDVMGIQALKRFPMIPGSISIDTSVIEASSFAVQFERLKNTLARKKYDKVPFELKFQLQKLAQNGYLSPAKVTKLLAVISHHVENMDVRIVTRSVRNLLGQIPFPGPETESSDFSIEALTEILVDSQKSILRGESYSTGLADQYNHLASIHKAIVTPAGVYLDGPEPEIQNRVLRRYSSSTNYFLSVSFFDEDWESLRLDRRTSGEAIYRGRYDAVLRTGINIVGRQYEVNPISSHTTQVELIILLVLGIFPFVITVADLLVHGSICLRWQLNIRQVCYQMPRGFQPDTISCEVCGSHRAVLLSNF